MVSPNFRLSASQIAPELEMFMRFLPTQHEQEAKVAIFATQANRHPKNCISY